MDTLLNFSGGLDSAYCLYWYLKNNQSKILLVHHINLINVGNRYKYEREAVENILNWCKKNNLNNFKFIETTVDYSCFNVRVLDGKIVAMMTGMILFDRQYECIRKVISAGPRDEYERLGDTLTSRQITDRKIRNLFAGKKRISMIYPIKHMYKKDIIKETPKEIFNMSFSCRHPLEGGLSCGECHTCKQIMEV